VITDCTMYNRKSAKRMVYTMRLEPPNDHLLIIGIMKHKLFTASNA